MASTGADGLLAHDVQELGHIIAGILEKNQGAVFCPSMTAKEKLAPIPLERLTSRPEDAQMAIEEVCAGIAETGSVVCSSSMGKPLSAGLLPQHHVVIVSSRSLFLTLEDFLISCSPLPTHLTFVSGPSLYRRYRKDLDNRHARSG